MPEHEDRLEQQLRALAGVGSRSASALPAEEVRARGSRRRQRRVAVVAGLAAAAVVAASTVAVGVGNTAQVAPASPGPVPPGGWLQEVPEDFVIDAEPLPVGPSFGPLVGRSHGLDIPVPGCGLLGAAPQPVDALGVATPKTMRGVQVYVDADAAADRLRALVDSAQQCSEDAFTSVTLHWRTHWVVAPHSAEVVVRRDLSPGPELVRLTQRGNALALVQTSPQQPDPQRVGVQGLAGLLEQMCTFTVRGCRQSPTPPIDLPASPPTRDPTGSEDDEPAQPESPILAELVIDSDPPPKGDGSRKTGPGTGLNLLEIDVCGSEVLPADVEPVEDFAVHWRSIEYGQTRWVGLYPSEVDAQAAANRLVAAARDCERDPQGYDTFSGWEVIELSGQPVTLAVQRFGTGQVFGTGLTVHAVSVQGPTLSVVRIYGEGGSSPENIESVQSEAVTAVMGLAEQLWP